MIQYRFYKQLDFTVVALVIHIILSICISLQWAHTENLIQKETYEIFTAAHH